MTIDPKKLDLISIVGLGKRRKPRVDPKYAGFNRRMMAITFDMMLLLLIAPLVDKIFTAFYPMVDLDLGTLQDQMRSTGDEHAASQLFWQTLYDSGFLRRWIANVYAQYFAFVLYSGLCWLKWSATPGKMLMRVRVVDVANEKPISKKQAVLRTIGYLMSGLFFGLGFAWIAFDKKRQGLHDKLAHTAVIVMPFAFDWKSIFKSGSQAAGPSGSPAPSTVE